MLVESQVLHDNAIKILNTVTDLILKPSPVQIPRNVLWDCITYQHVKIYLLKSDNLDSEPSTNTGNSTLFYANVMLQTLYALYSEPQTKDGNVLDAVDQIIKRYWDSFENGDSVELVESDILDSATDKMSMISSQKSIESFKSETEATTPKLSFSTITENIQVLDLSGGTIQVPDKVDFSHTDSMQPDSPTSSIDETASFYSTATTESQPRLGHKQSVYFDALDLSAEEKLESLCISLDNSVPTTPSIIKDNADKWFWKLFRAS